jgi:citrate synthase
VGSTLADGYSVMAGAVGSLSGPLHGGANEGVLEMLETMGGPQMVRPFMEGKLARKEKILGLGHRVYKVKDPRANILQRLAEQLFDRFGTSPYYDTAREVERVADALLSAKGICPNVDFYSGIVYDRMGLARDLFTPIFAVSRIAGWCAHWLEQLGENRIYRPRQVYTGVREAPYVAANQRG